MTFKELTVSKGLSPKQVQDICGVASLRTIYYWFEKEPKPVYRMLIENYKSKN